MASFNKFENFVEDLAEKVHNLTSDQLECYLSNATPSASLDAVKADLAEIATGTDYTGPQDTQNSGSESGGTYTLTGTDIVITAATPDVAQFRYVVLQNTTTILECGSHHRFELFAVLRDTVAFSRTVLHDFRGLWR